LKLLMYIILQAMLVQFIARTKYVFIKFGNLMLTFNVSRLDKQYFWFGDLRYK